MEESVCGDRIGGGLEIACDGGQPVPRSGRIGMMNWLGTVRYKNVELQELKPGAGAGVPAGPVPLTPK